MSLLFKSGDLKPVIAEALANQCQLILVKDQGVYWLSQKGERLPSGRQKHIAYAVGCNPDVDPFDNWWERASAEFGGDDFAEWFDPADSLFKRILHDGWNLEVSATPTEIKLSAVAIS